MQEEKEQKAKDFIWNHLSEEGKGQMISVSEMSEEDRLPMYNREWLCWLDGKLEGGVITKEVARLSFPG